MRIHPFSYHQDIIRSGYRKLKNNWTFTLSNRFILGSTLISTGLIAWRFQSLPPQVPLWFSRPWGQDELAAPGWLFFLPAGILVWHLFNFLAAVYVVIENRVFTQILFFTSILISVMALITVVRILTLIT